jgi:hypothetical protein
VIVGCTESSHPAHPHPRRQWRSCPGAATGWACTSLTCRTLCSRALPWTGRHRSAAPRVSARGGRLAPGGRGSLGLWSAAMDGDAPIGSAQEFNATLLPPPRLLTHSHTPHPFAVYLVDRVIPMLPRLLCEELCRCGPAPGLRCAASERGSLCSAHSRCKRRCAAQPPRRPPPPSDPAA